MKVSEWIAIPENLEWYNKNIKNDKIMQTFLEAVDEELSFETRSPEMISGEMALTLHGRNVGAHRAVRLIRNASTAPVQVEEVVADYQTLNALMAMDYSEEDAKRIIKEHNQA